MDLDNGGDLALSLHSDGRAHGGHLRLDPNLPISFQFHTYSTPQPFVGHHRATVLSPGNSNSAVTAAYTFPLSSGPGHTGNGNGIGGQLTTNASTNKKNNNNGNNSNSSSNGGHSVTLATNGGQGMALLQSPPGTNRQFSGRGSRGSRNASESDKDSLASSRHRELHKTLEKNRRAHLRHCFEQLKTELPKSEYSDKKTSHINIIHCAIRYIQYLKRTEWEYEHEMERLARTKIRYQNQLAQAKEDVMATTGHHKGVSPVDIEEVLLKAAAQVALNSVNGGTGKSSSSSSLMSAPSSASNLSLSGKSPLIHGLKSEEDESSDTTGDVIVELDAGEDYDDETTNTASGTLISCKL